jgi:hypothetical protein
VSGVALEAAGVGMAFLSDHHWILGYERSLQLGAYIWPALLVGSLFFFGGSTGWAAKSSVGTALYLGFGLIACSFLTAMIGGWERILNIHSWRVVFVIPIFAGVLSAMTSTLVGLLKLLRCRSRTS